MKPVLRFLKAKVTDNILMVEASQIHPRYAGQQNSTTTYLVKT
jgi:hypothetical protein